MLRNLVFAAAVLLTGAGAAAQTAAVPADTAQGDVSVTIYNNGRALVEDSRTFIPEEQPEVLVAELTRFVDLSS